MVHCAECGTANNFLLEAGGGYCGVCGTLSQDIREEVAEFDETLFGGLNRTIKLGNTSVSQPSAPETIWTLPEAVQTILLIQTKSLLSRTQLPNNFTSAVGRTWFRFLAKLGVITLPEITAIQLVEEYSVCIHDNLAIIYLTLISLDFPVLVSDIINWITDGSIPFFCTSKLVPQFKPRQLLGRALWVKTLPTIAALTARIRSVMTVLEMGSSHQDQSWTLHQVFLRLMSTYAIQGSDVVLLSLGVYSRFYGIGVVPGDLEIVACFLTALRLWFQFENPNYDKTSWLCWSREFLKTRHKMKVSHSMSQNFLKKYDFVTEKHFLNLPLDQYLSKMEAVLPQYQAIYKERNMVDEVKRQLSDIFLEHIGTKEALHQELNPSSAELIPGSPSKPPKRCSTKRRSTIKTKPRTLIVYPTDKLPEDQSLLPLELHILLTDLSSAHHLSSQDLFKEIQTITRTLVLLTKE